MNLFEIIYESYLEGLEEAKSVYEAYERLTANNNNIEYHNFVSDLLGDIEAEVSRKAFKAGFAAAVELLTQHL